MIGTHGAWGGALRGGRVAWVLAAALAAGCVPVRAPAVIEAGYRLVLGASDADGDGVLGRDEVAAMIDRAIPADRRDGGWERLRGWLVARFAEQDRNGDGLLSAEELAAGPVAAFRCIDRDGDGRIEAGDAAADWGMCLVENF